MYENFELFGPTWSRLGATPGKSSGPLAGRPRGWGSRMLKRPDMKLDVCPIREALNRVLFLFHNTSQPDNDGMISEESTGGFFIWDILRHLGKPFLNPKHS